MVDTVNSRVEKWVSGIPPTYASGNYFGSYGGNYKSTANPTQFRYPSGIAIDTATTGAGCGTGPCLWIVDTGNDRIVSCTVAGIGGSGPTCNVPSIFSPLGWGAEPYGGIAVDSSQNVYVAFSGNGGVLKLLQSGLYTTSSQLSVGVSANGIAIDSSNNLWVADGTGSVSTHIDSALSQRSNPTPRLLPLKVKQVSARTGHAALRADREQRSIQAGKFQRCSERFQSHLK